jgi:hypothetical protein
MLRLRKSQKARTSYSLTNIIVHEDLQSPPSLSEETLNVKTPSKSRALTRQSCTRQIYLVKSLQVAEETDIFHRQYYI